MIFNESENSNNKLRTDSSNSQSYCTYDCSTIIETSLFCIEPYPDNHGSQLC